MKDGGAMYPLKMGKASCSYQSPTSIHSPLLPLQLLLPLKSVGCKVMKKRARKRRRMRRKKFSVSRHRRRGWNWKQSTVCATSKPVSPLNNPRNPPARSILREINLSHRSALAHVMHTNVTSLYPSSSLLHAILHPFQTGYVIVALPRLPLSTPVNPCS
jgi:hypothetical protein